MDRLTWIVWGKLWFSRINFWHNRNYNKTMLHDAIHLFCSTLWPITLTISPTSVHYVKGQFIITLLAGIGWDKFWWSLIKSNVIITKINYLKYIINKNCWRVPWYKILYTYLAVHSDQWYASFHRFQVILEKANSGVILSKYTSIVFAYLGNDDFVSYSRRE